jgi:hypothetical protein
MYTIAAFPFSGEPKYTDMAATEAHKCAIFNKIGKSFKVLSKLEPTANTAESKNAYLIYKPLPIYVIKTDLMQYLSSVYFVRQPLHVSDIFVAHHQEVYGIYTTVGTCCAF